MSPYCKGREVQLRHEYGIHLTYYREMYLIDKCLQLNIVKSERFTEQKTSTNYQGQGHKTAGEAARGPRLHLFDRIATVTLTIFNIRSNHISLT